MTEEHKMYAEGVRGFFQTELSPNIERWRKAGIVDRDLWRSAGEAGVLGATIPEEFGGTGAPHSFDAISYLEHSRTGDSGWGLPIQSIVAHYIMSYGTDRQKARWLPALASGERVAAIAMTEPGTGSDLQSIKTTARADGEHYVINGSKTFITNGQLGDLVCVVARTQREGPGSRSISLVFVETEEAEGFRRGRNLEKMGLKSADTSELFFEDVRVPKDNLLGEVEGQGFAQLMTQLPWERLIIAIGAVGAMDYVLKETLAYTRERKAFGKRVFDFQNSKFKLAEVKTKLEVTRAFVDACIVKQDAGQLDAATASMAKYWAAETQIDVANECLQLFGGYGYMMEYPIAHAYVDARVQSIYGGTTEIMKELIARSLDQD